MLYEANKQRGSVEIQMDAGSWRRAADLMKGDLKQAALMRLIRESTEGMRTSEHVRIRVTNAQRDTLDTLVG